MNKFGIITKNLNILTLAIFTLLVVGYLVLASSSHLNPIVVFAQTPSEHCNCTLDYLPPNTINLTSITIPKVSIVINESITSETEGELTWNAVKAAQLMNVVTDKFLFGNFTSGTAATVALNIITAKPNESYGVQINGGTIPNSAKAEYQLKYDKIKKLGSTKSGFSLDLQEPGYYLLLITLNYDSRDFNVETERQNPMSITYESVLKIQ
jgi:hypothetical protein